ncbi:hypothetical protein AVEN_158561-2-1, partial [Araneus ventricosus]
ISCDEKAKFRLRDIFL